MADYASTVLCEAILLADAQEAYGMVQALLEAGEDPNGIDAGCYSMRPLYLAWSEECDSKKRGLVKLLIDHGAKAYPEEEPLDYICMCLAPIESTLLIFELGHSFKEFITESGSESLCEDNPLTYFLDHDRIDLIEQLRQYDLMCLLNAFNCLGLTPLAEMARDGEIEKANWLLEQRAEINANCELRVGNTALDEAVESGNLEMVELLLDAGANPNIPTCMSVQAVLRAQLEWEKQKKSSKAKKIYKMVLDASKKHPKVSRD